MFSCGGCDHRWSGLQLCHCAACHETFTTINAFDRHRDTDRCRRPKFAKRSDGLHLYFRSLKGKGAWGLANYDANGTLRLPPSVARRRSDVQ